MPWCNCPDCGHEWRVLSRRVVRNHECPNCFGVRKEIATAGIPAAVQRAEKAEAEVRRLREQIGIERELLADAYRELKALFPGNVWSITMRIERRMDAWQKEVKDDH